MGYITLGTGHHHSQHHPLNFRSLQGLEQNGKQKAQLSPTNSNSDHSSTTTTSNKKCMNCNGGTSSPSTASTTSTGKVSHDMRYLRSSLVLEAVDVPLDFLEVPSYLSFLMYPSNKKCMNCIGGTSSPSTASTTSTGKVSLDMSHIYLPNF